MTNDQRIYASLASRSEAPTAAAKGIPLEAGIAWQANAFDIERKAVTVEGRTWCRDDHPSVANTKAPAAAGAARAVVLRELEWSAHYYDRGGDGQLSCPSCHEDKRDGHAKDCALHAALAAPASTPEAK